MKIQLWSYNYDPEPTGIGPISGLFARRLLQAGHEVEVVAAHPHYPEPRWGTSRRPYKELRDGLLVRRLPLWIGRRTAFQRYRQELTYAAVHSAALPWFGRPDVLVAVSPSFPALIPAIAYGRLRGTPWVLWLQDILPDGALSTNVLKDGRVLRAARALERVAYEEAAAVAVVSRSFRKNLAGKAVDLEKIHLVPNPASRWPEQPQARRYKGSELRVLCMGNIGFSQGLATLIDALERAAVPGDAEVRVVITGTGVAESEVRSVIRSDRVELLGVVDADRLEQELTLADLALVTQRHGGAEFNMPSKVSTFMAWGLPILAAVEPHGEVARVIHEAGAGWVTNSGDPQAFPTMLQEIARSPGKRLEAGASARRYAEENFSIDAFGAKWDVILSAALSVRDR